jgi:membrane-associated phospholipid phosphatase
VKGKVLLAVVAVFVAGVCQVQAQTPADRAVLKGLAPVTELSKSAAGRAALGSNFTVSGGIQTGTIRQPLLMTFPEQQQQALRDAFVTHGNLSMLADGLGTTLGAAYQARAHYTDWQHFTNISQPVADLIAYTTGAIAPHSDGAKFFFANGTTNGKTPVSAEALAIITERNGTTDPFGKAYGLPGGSAGADPYGNSRPFQTEPEVARIVGFDYLHVPADNFVYSRGPMMVLTDSPSYPSGHTSWGYMGSALLAVLVPSRYQQMITRGAEYGNDRIVLGAHYAMDVLGGRTLALHDMAHLLANDPAYVGQTMKRAPTITDYRAAIMKARGEIAAVLEAACGKSVDACAREDIGRFNNAAANEAFYATTQTYNLPVVHPETAGVLEDVGKLAPEAGYLLTVAFPSLTLEQANRILTETQGPGGGFLDNGSEFGVYSRLNLYAAAGRAAQVTSGK